MTGRPHSCHPSRDGSAPECDTRRDTRERFQRLGTHRSSSDQTVLMHIPAGTPRPRPCVPALKDHGAPAPVVGSQVPCGPQDTAQPSATMGAQLPTRLGSRSPHRYTHVSHPHLIQSGDGVCAGPRKRAGGESPPWTSLAAEQTASLDEVLSSNHPSP